MRVQIEEDDAIEVQMGPLIDCVFLLLIFFLVVAVTKKSIKELDISLPEARMTVDAKPRDADMVIRVTREGVAFLSSDEMTPQTLRRAIRQQALATTDRKVRLEADLRTPMRVLAPILDELQFSGFQHVAIRVAADGR